MDVTFDPAKDLLNQVVHGLSLSLASELEWDTLMSRPDQRRNYGEPRMIGYALRGERLYCVVYVDREDARRIIRLRKANSREVIRYAEND